MKRSKNALFTLQLRALSVLATFAAFLLTPFLLTKGLALEKNQYARAYDKAVPSVVSIRGEKRFDANEMQKLNLKGRKTDKEKRENVTGMGSGVIIDERGYIVTNYHVVKGLQKIQVTTHDEALYRDVEFVSYDPKTDLALLRVVPVTPLKPIKFGNINEVYVCQDVMAIGNPFGYSGAAARGIVSGLNRPLTSLETASYDSVIQTDAAINPGNSGGPLINLDGEMIGINAAVRDDAQNIAFAIPVDMVASVTDRMLKISVAKLSHHGLTLEQTENHQVRIAQVEPNSPADRAGIYPGDILLESNRIKIDTPLDFTRSLIGVTLSDSLTLTVSHSGRTSEMSVAMSQLANSAGRENTVAVNRPITQAVAQEEIIHPASSIDSESESTQISEPANTPMSEEEYVENILGISIEPISAQEYKKLYPELSVVSMENYKIVPSGGVRITNVQSNTVFTAGRSSVREGDLIFGFVVAGSQENRWEISSIDNLYFIANKWSEFERNGDEVKIYLIRNGAPYYLTIPTAK